MNDPLIPDERRVVLVVDDDPRNRKVMRAMLGSEGWDVVEAASGEEALQAAAKSDFDLCLLDVMMPGIDGYEVAKHLEGDPRTTHVPIIVVSALQDEESRLRALSSGAEDFLSRPVNRLELVTRVRNLLKLKAYGDALRRERDRLGELVEEKVAEVLASKDALREQADLHRAIVATVPDVIAIVSGDGTIEFVNRSVDGNPPESLTGSNMLSYVSQYDQEVLTNTVESATRGRSLRTCRVRGTVPGGKERTYDLRVGPFGDPARGRLIVVADDITREVESQREIRRGEAREKTLSGHLPYLTYEAGLPPSSRTPREGDPGAQLAAFADDMTAQGFMVTGGGYALTGFDPNDIDPILWAAQIHPDDQRRVAEALSRVADDGSWTIEYRWRRADGEYRWFLDRAVVEREGERRVMKGVALDVTERKELSERLSQSQRLEAVGQLAGGCAHDFNNLLTPIIGFADLLRGSFADGAPQLEDVDYILEAARRAATITRQLLCFSRQHVTELCPLNLSESVRAISPLLERTLGERIRFVYDYPDEEAVTTADSVQIDQVILNLAINARDAMPEGGELRLSVGTTESTKVDRRLGLDPGPYVTLTVADTGVGMDDATRQKIFDPFFTTKGPDQGTGLGLATCFGIVRERGGAIDVSSEPGEGATFTVYFPSHAGSAPPTMLDLPTARPSGNETILLVEDDARVRAMAVRVLEGAGYTVLAAPDADDAMRLYRGHQGAVSMLYSDIVLPIGDGRTLAATLRELDPTLPVLLTSGYSGDAPRGGVPNKKQYPVLWKPYGAQQLLTAIRRVLNGAAAGSADRESLG